MSFHDTDAFIPSKSVYHMELKICRFYLKIIKDYFNLESNAISVEKIDPKRGQRTYLKNSDLLNKPETLFLLSIQDTCLAMRKFFTFLMEYMEVSKYQSRKNVVKIYCVLGGSLFAALGICIVIDQAIEQNELPSKTCAKKICIIIAEKSQDKKKIFSYIVEKFNPRFKNVKIELELLHECPDRWSVDVYRKLNEVDIVVMARYFSQFHYLTAKIHFVKVILERMKEFSILFYLDSFNKIYYDTLKHSISKIESLIEIRSGKTVYEPLKNSRSRVKLSEFPILFNTNFKLVKFSTFIKCPGMKNDSSLGNAEWRNEMKIKVSQMLQEKNLLALHLMVEPQAKFASISPSTLQFRPNINKNNLESSKKAGVLSIPSISSNASTKEKIYITERFKKEKNNKLISQNGNCCSEEKNKPHIEVIKENKIAGKPVAINPRSQKAYSKKRGSYGKVFKTSKVAGNSVSTNPPNFEQEKHQNTGYVRKDSICLQDEDELQWLEEMELSVTNHANFLSDIYYSKYDKEKPTTLKVRLNKLPEIFLPVNEKTKNKYRCHRLKAKESSFSRYAKFNEG